MNHIRRRLSEIKEQLKNDNISNDKKTQLISEAKHLIPLENFDHQKQVIQNMVEDKYSEKKIWDHCQSEIEMLDHYLNENERLRNEALSIESPVGSNKKVHNVILTLTEQGFELVSRRKTFKDLQTFHCKNYNPDASSNQPIVTTNSSATSSSTYKPSKDTIYSWYRELREDHTVKNAFKLLGEKINEKGFKITDFYETDDALSFNRSFNKFKLKENKRKS